MAHILIVDDFKEGNLVLSGLLQRYGFQTTTTNSAISALNLLNIKSEQVDLIITDLYMPEMDGFALIEKIRQHAVYAEAPIIVLTGSSLNEDRERALSVGANAVFLKPYKRAELITTMNDLMGDSADDQEEIA